MRGTGTMRIFFTITNSNEAHHFNGVTNSIGCSMEIKDSDLPPDVVEFLERSVQCRKNGTINLESMHISYENPR